MTLLSYRTAVVDGIKAAMPQLYSVEAHAGRFDSGELKRVAAAAPAVRVALLRTSPADELASGQVRAAVRTSAFVMARSTAGLPRDEAVLALVDALLATVRGNEWGLDEVDRPQRMSADNLFAAELDERNIAMWAVTWTQNVYLGGLDEATLDALERVYTTWPVGDEDTADLEDDQTGLQG